jgi:hypothetical protein
MMVPMTGVVLLLVLAVGVVSLIVLANLIGIANADHERSGLFGAGPRHRRLEVEALTALVADDQEQTARSALSMVVTELDRLCFAGVPLARCSPTREFGWWQLAFRDGTDLLVQVGDPRAMTRARALVEREPIVVSRVQVHPDSAVVELSSPRHRPLRVALRG